MPSIEWNRARWTSSLQQYVQTQPGAYGDQWGTPQSKPALQSVIDSWLLPFVGPGQTILEIGPGGGRWTQYLLNARALHCVDINEVMLDYIIERFGHPAHLHPYQSAGSDLPALEPGAVDFVFSFGTFVHLEATEITAYLNNLRPLLHAGSNVILQYADKTKPKAAQNIHFSDNNALKMELLLQQQGYRVVRHDTALLDHSNIVHVRLAPEPAPPRTLSTAAPVRVLAWPDYRDPAELLGLFTQYGEALAMLPGCCLCLRCDPQHDLPVALIQQLVQEAFSLARLDCELELLLVDDPMSAADWPALGRAVTASLTLPSGAYGVRAAFSSALGVPRIRSITELTSLGTPALTPGRGSS